MMAVNMQSKEIEIGQDAKDLMMTQYNALCSEHQYRMTEARTQVWTLYLSAIGAFVFAALQGGNGPFIVALCPLVLTCLARHARHGEDVLTMLRKYLRQVEEKNGYRGYQTFTRTIVHKTHGGYMVALRDAFLLTDALAVASVLWRLSTDAVLYAPLVMAVVLAVDGFAAFVTWRLLPRHASKLQVKETVGDVETVKVVEAQASEVCNG
jgi:hypothetical protein